MSSNLGRRMPGFKPIIVAIGIAMSLVLIEGSYTDSLAQKGDTKEIGQVDSLVAATKRDLGLSYDPEGLAGDSADAQKSDGVDFTDSDDLIRRLRVLTKQLASSGQYSKAELLDIKVALQEAEADLVRTPAGAQRSGREAVERYFATVEGL